jgi:hypothetical protein
MIGLSSGDENDFLALDLCMMSNVILFPSAIDERRKVCLELLDKLEAELGRVRELIEICPEDATRARLARHRASLQDLVVFAKRQALAIQP